MVLGESLNFQKRFYRQSDGGSFQSYIIMIGKDERIGIMEQTITIICQAFRKNSDGSWTSAQITDVQTPTGAIRIGPGMTFRKGGTICGIDVATLLDQNCTNKGRAV